MNHSEDEFYVLIYKNMKISFYESTNTNTPPNFQYEHLFLYVDKQNNQLCSIFFSSCQPVLAIFSLYTVSAKFDIAVYYLKTEQKKYSIYLLLSVLSHQIF